MKQFLDYIFGTADYPLYAAEWFFALIGAFLSLRLHAYSRDKQSPSTPVKFSWRFLVYDNALRLLTTVVLLFIFMRFPEYLLKIDAVKDNITLVLVVAFGVGFSNDKLAQLLKKFNVAGIANSSVRKQFDNVQDPSQARVADRRDDAPVGKP